MDPPPVQYVTTSDGCSIAYGVSGKGPPIVVLPYAFEHVQLAWQYPVLGAWLRALADRFTVIQLDTRGSGLSSRDLGVDFTVEHYQRDIHAVVAHLRLDDVVFWAVTTGCVMAARYAIDHPHRVKALIFSSPGRARSQSFWTEVSKEDWEMFLHSVVPRDRSADDARRQVELLKQSFDKENFVRRTRAALEVDYLGLWGRLATPTLVLHAMDYALIDIAGPVRTAQLLGASLTLIDGSHVYGDPNQGIQAIEEFLARIPKDYHAPSSVEELSAREVEVLRLLAAGRSNAQIADELVISLNTVRRHVSNIFAKIGAENRTEADSYAHRKGII